MTDGQSAGLERDIAVAFRHLLEVDAMLAGWDRAQPPVDRIDTLITSVETSLTDIERRLRVARLSTLRPQIA